MILTRFSTMSAHDAGVAPAAILVIEPDILIRTGIAEYLRDCGYRVIEAGTSDDAVALFGSKQKIDVVLCDARPGGSMDGFGLAQWIRHNHPDTDVILASGISGAAQKAGELCEDGSVRKPYEPAEVVRRINLAIERRRSSPVPRK